MRISDWSSDVCSSDLAFAGELWSIAHQPESLRKGGCKGAGHARAVDQDAHFGVEQQGAGIEIERTDKNLFLVDRKGLGVETREGRSCAAPDIGHVVYRKGWVEFVKLDPGQQELRRGHHQSAATGRGRGRER